MKTEIVGIGQRILNLAQVAYPSHVRRGGWYDVSPPVRVTHKLSGKEEGVHLVDPVQDVAIFVGCDNVISLTDYILAAYQGGPVTSQELTPEILETVGIFLNVVADERVLGSDGTTRVQTPNAVAARTLLNLLYVQRRKGLSLPSVLSPNRSL
ncbi:MAG: hypothetical protein HGA67_02455 [Candidatus Yonathbacteria bacterium]|nr:hypothetical protein [Candidatus Yonathbacteria bacterium]